MKRTILLICITFLIFSCGKNGGKTVEKAVETVEKKVPCDFTQLKKVDGIFKKDSMPYTGDAQKLDQNDSVIEYATFKNGYMTLRIAKKKFGKDYYISDSLTYQDGKEENGFKKVYESNLGVKYTSSWNYFENGKSIYGGDGIKGGEVTVSKSYSGYEIVFQKNWYIVERLSDCENKEQMLDFFKKIKKMDNKFEYWSK